MDLGLEFGGGCSCYNKIGSSRAHPCSLHSAHICAHVLHGRSHAIFRNAELGIGCNGMGSGAEPQLLRNFSEVTPY